mgnify:CR=1 FL=1
MKITIATILLFLAWATTAQAATLTWQSNSGGTETGFKIYRATTAISNFVQVDSVAANIVIFLDPAGAPGNCWRVTAFNSAGESQPSNVACLAQPVIIIPLSPSGTGVVP